MNNDKFTFLMVLHGHQPVGNFHHVFADAVERCYRPVLEMLGQYPEFKVGLHFSGPLLSWLAANDPGFLDLAAFLCGRGQVEMLGGGYYEPLLASIPARDARAQVIKQSEFTLERFGQSPTGLWLAERIWEPSLPAKLAGLGIGYTLVDDTHFYYAGLNEPDMFGFRITEREGAALKLFPTHKILRYTIPFREPVETMDFLKSAHDRFGPTAAIYGDDIEKFGLWPGTYEWVLEKGWLRRFIEAVLAEDSWLATGHPGAYAKERTASGRVYPPTASYEEMLEWALPADTAVEMAELTAELKDQGSYEKMRRFLRGGLWDNFLVKYRESNLMHKRMLDISRKLHQAGITGEALDHLHQAQCNCAYWHGLFGGLYLGHLRAAVHEHLIAAESLCDRQRRGPGPWAAARSIDLDLDGADEVILSGPEMDLMIHPAHGGGVSLLNLRKARANLALALTRRKEAYHAQLSFAPNGGEPEQGEVQSPHDRVIVKEAGLGEYLIYDWYERGLFQDHLLAPGTQLDDYARARHHEWGDFVNQPYEVLRYGAEGDKAWCKLRRNGHVWASGQAWPLTVEKTYELSPAGVLRVEYLLDPEIPRGREAWLAIEFNYSMLAGDDPQKQLLANGRSFDLMIPEREERVSALELINRADAYHLSLALSEPALVWSFPIQTVSQSESGLERTYQGSSLSMIWPLIGPRRKRRFVIELKLL